MAASTHVALLLMFLPLFACGCLVKTGEFRTPLAAHDDARIYRAKRLKLQDGVSTRADVERVLGAPDYARDGGGLVAYRWQRMRYDTHKLVPRFIPVGSGEKDVIDLDPDDEASVPVAAAVQYTSLLLRFDDAGVLQARRKFRHEVTHGGPPSLPDLIAAWQDETASR